MGFPSGLPFCSPGDLPDPGLNLCPCRQIIYQWATGEVMQNIFLTSIDIKNSVIFDITLMSADNLITWLLHHLFKQFLDGHLGVSEFSIQVVAFTIILYMQQLSENVHRISRFKTHNYFYSLFEGKNDSKFHFLILSHSTGNSHWMVFHGNILGVCSFEHQSFEMNVNKDAELNFLV